MIAYNITIHRLRSGKVPLKFKGIALSSSQEVAVNKSRQTVKNRLKSINEWKKGDELKVMQVTKYRPDFITFNTEKFRKPTLVEKIKNFIGI